MNLGKPSNPKPGNGVDDFVERLNKLLSRLLGKKNNHKPRTPASNMSFALIILTSILTLWICTGFYYLDENEYGIILSNGRVVKVNKGLKLGLSLPYPFGSVEIIDTTPSKLLDIASVSTDSKGFVVLDKNLLPFVIFGKFSYSITNPKLLYLRHYQNQDSFDNEVTWQVKAKVKNIAANSDFSKLKMVNFTVLSNDLHNALNRQLSEYGITLTKFDIAEIHLLNADSVESSSKFVKQQEDTRPLAIQLQDEARRYNINTVAKATEDLVQFDQLLSKYQKQPQQTIEQMYLDSLNRVALAKIDDYPLLFLNLSQLKQLESGITPVMENDKDIREPLRDVNRDRMVGRADL